MEIFTFENPQKCIFKAPLLSTAKVSPENRFGASLNLINNFRTTLLNTKRNNQLVRAKWEVEWQSTDQSQKANAFLREIISYKVNIVPSLSLRSS